MEVKHQGLLQACDKVRDESFVECGVRLEDRPNAASVWKLEDPETLRREQREKEDKKRAEIVKKARNKIGIAEKELQKWQDLVISPSDFFAKKFPGEFSAFDDEGLPTKTVDGEELSKKARKNAEGNLKKHQKGHEDLLAKAGDGVDSFLKGHEEAVAKLKADLEALNVSDSE